MEEESPPPPSQKGKSCKGCLYYSSLLKSDARNPVCVGITRTLPQVPEHIVGESELEAAKEGRSLSNFKYGCVGYSVFLDNRDNNNNNSTEMKGENRAELPFCIGIELLVDRRKSNDHAPTHTHKEDKKSSSPHYQTGQASREDFFGRFSRNAGLVTSGVTRNLNKIGNYVKETINDILYPYRKRPK